jgi:PAP2 superfamily
MPEREGGIVPGDRAALRRLAAALIVAAVAAQALALTGSADSLGLAVLGDSFLASSLAGAALLTVLSLPRALGVAALILGVILEVALALVLPRPEDPAAFIVARGAGLGLAALAVTALHAGRSTGEARARALDALCMAAVLPLFVVASAAALDLTSTLHPLTLDGPFLRADRWLGQPSFVVGRWFGAAPPLGQSCAVIYGELPLFLAAVVAMERRRQARWPVEIPSAFVWLGVCGYFLYHLFPVAGPRFAVATWPGRVPPLEAMPAHAAPLPPVPRNCMPSLHTAWVILCAIFARRAPLGFRALSWLWVAGTLTATLGLGLHYGVDLIAALPFLAVFWLIWRARRPPAPSGLAPLDEPLLAFAAAGSVVVAAGAVRAQPTVLAAEVLLGLLLGAAWSARRGSLPPRVAAVALPLVAAGLPLWMRPEGFAVGLVAVALPSALAAASLSPSALTLAGAALGALGAAALQPALGRSVSALVLAMPALAALRRKTTTPPEAREPVSRHALALVIGAALAAVASTARIRFGAASGEDYLTTPLFLAVTLGAAALGGRIRAPWPVGIVALALAALLSPWSFGSMPGYLASFDNYPAVATLGARAAVRLAAAIWTVGPLAIGAGILARAAGSPRVSSLAGALAATLVVALPSWRAPLSREAWSRDPLPMTMPLDRLTPGELRVYLATAAASMPDLLITFDGDEARLCTTACEKPVGPHLGRAEIDKLLRTGLVDPAELVATDDNLLLGEALTPLRHFGASRETSLALLRSFAAP